MGSDLVLGPLERETLGRLVDAIAELERLVAPVMPAATVEEDPS